MSRFAFVGGSYQAQSLAADAQMCMNFYAERDDSGAGKSELILLPTPGLVVFSALAGPSVQAGIEINGRVFFCSGKFFYELFADGTFTARFSNLAQNANPASLAASAVQVMIASGGQGYCWDLRTNTMTGPIANIAGALQVGYADGFFVAIVNQIGAQPELFVSNPEDGTTWNPGQVSLVSVYPGNIVSLVYDHRELCVLGNRQSVCYYDSGNTFPFDVIPGGFMETGSAATFGVSKIDNTYFFWHQSERGARHAVRVSGYTPQRISTHAIEDAIKQYPKISDAVCYAYEDDGHSFWVTYFPTANKTWVYDVATGLWHERGYFSNGVYSAHRSMCHVYAFEKHLVGDPFSGNVYEMRIPTFTNNAWTFADDAGQPIRRVRRSPYVISESRWVMIDDFELDAEAGIGNNPSGGLAIGVQNITLADANGALWNITIDDGGLLHSTVVATGTAQSIVFSDSVLANTFWTLGITIGGLLTTTAIVNPLQSVVSINFVSSPSSLQTALYVKSGLLTTNVPQNVPRAPFATLRWSNDRGRSWSNGRQMSLGNLGEYGRRMIERRLGRFWGTTGRVFELSYADTIPLRIVDAHINGKPDHVPTPRIADRLRAGA